MRSVVQINRSAQVPRHSALTSGQGSRGSFPSVQDSRGGSPLTPPWAWEWVLGGVVPRWHHRFRASVCPQAPRADLPDGEERHGERQGAHREITACVRGPRRRCVGGGVRWRGRCLRGQGRTANQNGDRAGRAEILQRFGAHRDDRRNVTGTRHGDPLCFTVFGEQGKQTAGFHAAGLFCSSRRDPCPNRPDLETRRRAHPCRGRVFAGRRQSAVRPTSPFALRYVPVAGFEAPNPDNDG